MKLSQYSKNKSISTRLDKVFQRKLVNIFLPSVLTYVLGAQKNHLIETVVLSNPQNMFCLRNNKNIFVTTLN